MEVQLMTVIPTLSVLLCVTCSIAIILCMTSQELLQPYVAVKITACMVSYSYAWDCSYVTKIKHTNLAIASYFQWNIASYTPLQLHTIKAISCRTFSITRKLEQLQLYHNVYNTIKAAGAKIMTSPISVIVFKAKESIILNPLLLTTIINNVYRYPCQKMLHLDRQLPKDVSSWQRGNCL